jgi:hypothetical protein
MAGSTQRIVIYRMGSNRIIAAPSSPGGVANRRKLKVTRGTYADELIDRLYYFLIGRSIDLREEYRKFYLPEYPTMSSFLYQKLGITRRLVKALEPLIARGDYVGLVRSSWGRDWQLQSLSECCETRFIALMKAIDACWTEACNED